MVFDFGAFWSSLAANAILLTPVEVAVVLLVARIYREVGKLAALYEVVPDMTAEERRFAAWWMKSAMRNEMRTARLMAEPGKPVPWEV